MILPSSICERTTQTVGFFEIDATRFASWLVERLGVDWNMRSAPGSSLAEFCESMAPVGPWSRSLLLPVDGWIAYLTDGPLGTDVGVLPHRSARDLGCRAMRVTAAEPSAERYGATILEVFDPAVQEHILRVRRTISAADDGGRWAFDQSGEPFEFEDLEAYKRRRIRNRFGPELLERYLLELGVPVNSEPDYKNALFVERKRV